MDEILQDTDKEILSGEIVSGGIDTSKLSPDDLARAMGCWTEGIPAEYDSPGYRLLKNGAIFDNSTSRMVKNPVGGPDTIINKDNASEFKRARIQARIEARESFLSGMGRNYGGSWLGAWEEVGSSMVDQAVRGKVKAAEFIGKAADLFSRDASGSGSGSGGGVSISLDEDLARYLVDRIVQSRIPGEPIED